MLAPMSAHDPMDPSGDPLDAELESLILAAHSRRCSATNRQENPCGNRAIRGGTVCRMHGGAAPQVMAKAADRLAALRDLAAERLFVLIGNEGQAVDPKVLLDAVVKLTGQVELLEGRATARSESVTQDQQEQVRARIVGRIDDLARKREEREGREDKERGEEAV